jgi:hypothetical protein
MNWSWITGKTGEHERRKDDLPEDKKNDADSDGASLDK